MVRPEKIGNFAANRGGGSWDKDFDPDCYISMWYQDKVWWVSAAKPHNYPKKRKCSSASNGIMDIAGFTLSDLEDDNKENFEGFQIFM